MVDGIDPRPLVWDDLNADADNDGYPLWLELLYGTSDTEAGDVAALLQHGSHTVTLYITGATDPAAIFTIGIYPLLLGGRTTFSLDLPLGASVPLALANASGASVTTTSSGCIALTGGSGGLTPGGMGNGAATLALPMLAIESDVPSGHCCHYHRYPCATYTAISTPPLQGAWEWWLDGGVVAEGTNRLDLGHNLSGLIQVSFTPNGGNSTIWDEIEHYPNCHRFVEYIPNATSTTNLIYANPDDDNHNGQPDHASFLFRSSMMLPVTPCPLRCSCVTHNATNWSCRSG